MLKYKKFKIKLYLFADKIIMFRFLKKLQGRLGMDRTLKPDYKRATNTALQILKDFEITAAPVDPAKIARDLGIIVNFARFPKHDNVSGFYNADQNAIYVNINEAPARMTFTIAHELGHYHLHQEWVKSSEYKILFRNQVLTAQKDPKEQEANKFAANLLVPKFLLDQYDIKKLFINSLISISEIATMFAVSADVIKLRLKDECGL